MQTLHWPALQSIFALCIHQCVPSLIIVVLTYTWACYFQTFNFQNISKLFPLTIRIDISLNRNNNKNMLSTDNKIKFYNFNNINFRFLGRIKL